MEMPDVREKFDNKYEIKQSGCWEWTGYRLPKGYGYINIGGKSTGAHRVSYIIHKGEIPNGMHVHHICENTCCVNPEHLTILTPEDNLKLNSSPIAINSRKKFCKRGHEFNEDNTRYIKRNGKLHRRCRQCHNESCKQKRHRDKTDHSRVVEALREENEENCRLLGMSAERELALLAEIDRLKAKLAKTEWQPIETAPHGIWILIFAYENVCQACWDSNGYWSTFRENRIQPIAATHWMPLPEPPTTEETK